jgi:hypothetical protein
LGQGPGGLGWVTVGPQLLGFGQVILSPLFFISASFLFFSFIY